MAYKILSNHQVCDEKFNYIYNEVIYEQNGNVYITNTSKNADINGGDLIDPRTIFPEYCNSIIKCPDYIIRSEYTHIKYFKWVSDKNICLNEISIMEKLMKHPHPNLPRYYGCLTENNLVRGIVLGKYSVYNDNLYTDKVHEDLKSVLNHLHSLDLVHCDVNNRNIVFDGPKVILIDFDSCKKIGSNMCNGKSGIYGWELDTVKATPDNDWYSLSKLLRYARSDDPNKNITGW
jgi:serine/threonine protein kinase